MDSQKPVQASAISGNSGQLELERVTLDSVQSQIIEAHRKREVALLNRRVYVNRMTKLNTKLYEEDSEIARVNLRNIVYVLSHQIAKCERIDKEQEANINFLLFIYNILEAEQAD